MITQLRLLVKNIIQQMLIDVTLIVCYEGLIALCYFSLMHIKLYCFCLFVGKSYLMMCVSSNDRPAQVHWLKTGRKLLRQRDVVPEYQ